MIEFAKKYIARGHYEDCVQNVCEVLSIVSSGIELKLIKCCWGLGSWYSLRLTLTKIANKDLVITSVYICWAVT